jgi:hypothetical protein
MDVSPNGELLKSGLFGQPSRYCGLPNQGVAYIPPQLFPIFLANHSLKYIFILTFFTVLSNHNDLK